MKTHVLNIPLCNNAFNLMWQFLAGKSCQLQNVTIENAMLSMHILIYDAEPQAIADFIFLGMTAHELQTYGKPTIYEYVKPPKRPVGRPRKHSRVIPDQLLLPIEQQN